MSEDTRKRDSFREFSPDSSRNWGRSEGLKTTATKKDSRLSELISRGDLSRVTANEAKKSNGNS